MYRFAPILGALDFALSVTSARADIFQWEYINPADPSQGKQQSTTLAPDGAGVDAVLGADLRGRNLTMAYLIGADLTGAYGSYANLTNADLGHANLTNPYPDCSKLTGANLSQANLANASFDFATLTDSNFTGAEVRGATFYPRYDDNTNMYVGGLTLTQLYSTASYQAHDLAGIGLYVSDLSGGNF